MLDFQWLHDERKLHRAETVVEVVKVVAGAALIVFGILIAWRHTFAFTGFSPDPIPCTAYARDVHCPSATYTTRTGSAHLEYGTRTDGTHPAPPAYTYGSVCTDSGCTVGISFTGSSPIPATDGFLPSSPSGCGSVTSIRIAWVDNTTIQSSDPIDTPGGICSGAPDQLDVTISASNSPLTTGGIAYEGHIQPQSALLTGEYLINAYVTITSDATGHANRFAIGVDSIDSASGTYSTSDAAAAVVWPPGSYSVSVTEVTTARQLTASTAVTVASHVPIDDTGGGGSWGADGLPVAFGAPGVPTASFQSYGPCLQLSAAAFGCFFNATKSNLAGLPLINLFTSLPSNVAYAVNAATATVDLYIPIPAGPSGAWSQSKIELYNSTSSTDGILGQATSEAWQAWLAAWRIVLYVLAGILLILIILDFRKTL